MEPAKALNAPEGWTCLKARWRRTHPAHEQQADSPELPRPGGRAIFGRGIDVPREVSKAPLECARTASSVQFPRH
jgi:hypothetical protein